MLLKEVLDIYELVDSAYTSGELLKNYFLSLGAQDVAVKTIEAEKGSTDFIRIRIPGLRGRSSGGQAPTLGILGRLGGLGARPSKIGMVSDGDGALVALAVAARLLNMKRSGDSLEGDVVISTHICPDAPITPHEPVDFMGSPVDTALVNKEEVSGELDAILSVDTTKGNRIINHQGFAITPTVKEGYILRVSEDLLDRMERVRGDYPAVLAITDQDISPYGNGLYHINSIMQPSTATAAPVVGVAITTKAAVAGSATGASHFSDIEMAGRFCLEVAKDFGQGRCDFYNREEFHRIKALYGSKAHLQSLGRRD